MVLSLRYVWVITGYRLSQTTFISRSPRSLVLSFSAFLAHTRWACEREYYGSPMWAEMEQKMFKFIGISRVDFTPDGEKHPLQGYKFHFTDDFPLDSGNFGAVPFSQFVRDENAPAFGINSPSDMSKYGDAIGKPVELAFDRKGKVTAIKLPEPVVFPPDGKPNKLGA